MIKTTIKIDGMSCGMCEAHVNDCIRKACKAKKVTSNHSKGTAEIITENDINLTDVKNSLSSMGYIVLESSNEPYEKKGFSLFKRK